jgi:hypothetical protein
VVALLLELCSKYSQLLIDLIGGRRLGYRSGKTLDQVHGTRKEQDLVLEFCLTQAVAFSMELLPIPKSELIDATVEVPLISVAFAARLEFFLDVCVPSLSDF